MKQIFLPIFDSDKERRWFPEKYKNGDEFAVRLCSGIWEIATLVNGSWVCKNYTINPSSVTHWIDLKIREYICPRCGIRHDNNTEKPNF